MTEGTQSPGTPQAQEAAVAAAAQAPQVLTEPAQTLVGLGVMVRHHRDSAHSEHPAYLAAGAGAALSQGGQQDLVEPEEAAQAVFLLAVQVQRAQPIPAEAEGEAETPERPPPLAGREDLE